ncbi:hypothetical protein B7463_g6496, partial [Scytalidium lignicola]
MTHPHDDAAQTDFHYLSISRGQQAKESVASSVTTVPVADSSHCVPTMTCKASLDELPNELKVSILLYMHNIPTLQALVQSSSSYHEVYIIQRRLILSTVLSRDIPAEVLPDALAVQHASKIPFQTQDQRKIDIESAISQYKSQRTLFSPVTLRCLEIDCLTSLARLQSIIVDVNSDFCRSTLPLCPLNKEDMCDAELSGLCRSYPPKESYDCWKMDTAEESLSLGLAFLRRVLRAPSKLERAHLLKGNTGTWGTRFLSSALEQEPYDFMFPTDANEAYDAEEQLLFGSDSDVDSPNAAWPWSSDYKVDVWYFQIWKRGLRKWAYVMWDCDRLQRWNILDMNADEARRLE